ncbi:MAG: endopeptidase La [Acidimicrobiales bacterium]
MTDHFRNDTDPTGSAGSPRTSETLPILPLPDGVILPDMVVTVSIQSDEARQAVDVGTDRLLLVPRRTEGSGSFARVGVIGTIENRGKLPDGTPALTVRAHQRARVGAGVMGTTPGLWVEAEPIVEPDPNPAQVELAAEYRAAATTLLQRIGGRSMSAALREIETPSALADSIGYWPDLDLDQRITLLETIDVTERLVLAITWVKETLAEVEMRERINREVTDDLEKTQREAILRRQMAAIRSELDGTDDDVIGGYRARLDEVRDDLTGVAVTAIEREINRLERSGGESMEANWIRTWLDTVFELPWGIRIETQPELDDARTILEADHTGLEEVKDRLIEYLAVRKLRSERAVDERGDLSPTDRRRGGAILALVGPPGVGKTSLGESVARALDRPFVRLSLGGIRDEAEIRGHRRTYVGSRPGRVVRAMVEAGAMNPVVLLDEIDKLGNGWQGDPSAALLEVLDPAQNGTFRDHYLEFELDLSDVVFIATANVLDTIPGPLRDRLELITLDGYTASEKATIARRHLLPRLLGRNGVEADEVTLSDEVIDTVAAEYTREAGVRQLERLLDKLVRKAVTRIAEGGETPVVIEPGELRSLLGRPIPSEDPAGRIDRPGIATGLAVTGAGGDVLFVETALVAGEGEPLLTGQLGDVMKESASIARSVVAANGSALGVDLPADRRLHVHFPAGAVPKDGPSAGITMATALVSLLSGRKVRADVAMTGEVTLQGRVLPIGGVKQKLLAARRAGISEVLLPKANEGDLEDVPAEVTGALTVHLVEDITEVLGLALEPAPEPASAMA